MMRWVPLLVVLVLLGFFTVALWPEEKGEDFPLIDQATPALDLESLSRDARFTPALWAGEVAIVNIFASWCLPCVAEQPQLIELAKTQNVKLYGINYKDKPEALTAFLKKYGNPFAAIGIDAKGTTGLDWGITGVPETFIIDAKGRVRLHHRGPLMPEQLPAFIQVIQKVRDGA